MFQKNDIIKGKIESLAFQGQGIAKPDNFTIFVPRSVPGDLLNIKITDTKKTYAFGTIEEIITPSPERIDPACPAFKRCGGCHYQHVNPTLVQEQKQIQLKETYSRLGPGNIDPLPMIQNDNSWNYRNRIVFNRDSSGAQGYKTWFDKQTINIDNCAIANVELNQAWALIKSILQPVNAKVLPFVTLRKIGDKVAVIFTITKDFNKLELKKKFVDFPTPYFFYTTTIDKNAKTAMGSNFAPLFDEPLYLEENIGDVFYILRPDLFFQNNMDIAQKLIQKILEDFKDQKDPVLDLYCGSGLFSIPLAKKGIPVTGIEIQKEAIACAHQSSLRNGTDTLTDFQIGKSEDVIKTLMDEDKTFRRAIVDPPRRGLDASLIKLLPEIGVEELIYISCDPATLARDASILKRSGFALEYIQPFEMFPQTYHMEIFAKFSSK